MLPSVEDITQSIVHTGPGAPIIPEFTVTSYTFTVPKISISPLYLVHLILTSPFLSPTKSCRLLVVWVNSVGLSAKVDTFMDWLRMHAKTLQEINKALNGVDLADFTLHIREGIQRSLVPPPLTNSTHPPIKYLPLPPLHTTLSPPLKLVMGPSERWGYYLQCLLWICNITAVDKLSPIWHMFGHLSRYQARKPI